MGSLGSLGQQGKHYGPNWTSLHSSSSRLFSHCPSCLFCPPHRCHQWCNPCLHPHRSSCRGKVVAPQKTASRRSFLRPPPDKESQRSRTPRLKLSMFVKRDK